jgi:hypothetical protein
MRGDPSGAPKCPIHYPLINQKVMSVSLMWQHIIGQELSTDPCCLLIFSYFPNIFLHVPDGWLAEPHNSHSSMSHNMEAYVLIQFVMCGNQL